MDKAFFCDTGVIRGICHPNDKNIKKRQASQFCIEKYPPKKYDYFVTQVVIDELDHQTLVTTRNARCLSIHEQNKARTFQRKVDAFLRNCVTEFYIDDHELANFNDLVITYQNSIFKVKTHNDHNDIQIIANAVFWNLLTNYNSHFFLTADNKDIGKKRNEIVKIAETILKRKISLKIIYTIEYYFNNKNFLV